MTSADRGFWRGIAAQALRVQESEPRSKCGNGCSPSGICGTCIGALVEHTTDPRTWLLYHWSLRHASSFLAREGCDIAASLALSESETP